MFTESQTKALDQIAIESIDLGLRDQLAEDPCDWPNVFDLAWAQAFDMRANRMARLEDLAARTRAALDETE